MFRHEWIEKNAILLLVLTLLTVAIGGIVEIIPLFTIETTVEHVVGMRPYTPLELAGRHIYVREGCDLCQSQMIRALRDEVERYGNYSLAAESMYDHPFQWGSKRNGPDLARIGEKYSDDWHLAHLNEPRALVPQSIMPSYAFLGKTPLDYRAMADHLRVLRMEGVPYSDEMVANALVDVRTQVDPDSNAADAFVKRYPKAKLRKYDARSREITEADALVAYLQMLGTLVDFRLYDDKANLR